MLDIEDAIGNKVAALATRAEPRDYADTAAALGRYTVGELLEFACRVDAGLEARDFAWVGTALDSMDDEIFAFQGLSPQQILVLRQRFADWPRA